MQFTVVFFIRFLGNDFLYDTYPDARYRTADTIGTVDEMGQKSESASGIHCQDEPPLHIPGGQTLKACVHLFKR
jgi:hypothetical protein